MNKKTIFKLLLSVLSVQTFATNLELSNVQDTPKTTITPASSSEINPYTDSSSASTYTLPISTEGVKGAGGGGGGGGNDCPCPKSINKAIINYYYGNEQNCTVVFYFTEPNVCQNNYTYEWNFGDGTPTASGMTVGHSYSANGTYAITITVRKFPRDPNCRPAIVRGTVNINCHRLPCTCDQLTPSISSTLSPVRTVSFQNGLESSVCQSILRCTWNFGDGSPVSSANSPVHTYAAYGTYTVTLYTMDQKGNCIKKTTQVITLADPCTYLNNLSFTYSIPLGACSYEFVPPVLNGSNYTYHWDFGDNRPPVTTTSGIPVTHQYTSDATYNVTLTITEYNSAGNVVCSKTITKPVLVDCSEPKFCNYLKSTSFSFTDTGNCDFTFVNDLLYPQGHSFNWDFGDGSLPVTNLGNPSVTHHYNNSGTYAVTLNIAFYGSNGDLICAKVINKTIITNCATVDPCCIFNPFLSLPIVGQGTFMAYHHPGGVVCAIGKTITTTYDFGDGSDLGTTTILNYNPNSLDSRDFKNPIQHYYATDGEYVLTSTLSATGCAPVVTHFPVSVYRINGQKMSTGGLSNGNTNGLTDINVQLAPNPASDKLTVTLELTQASNVTIVLKSIDGKNLQAYQQSLQAGMQELQLVLPLQLEAGLIFAEIQVGDYKTVKKLFIAH